MKYLYNLAILLFIIYLYSCKQYTKIYTYYQYSSYEKCYQRPYKDVYPSIYRERCQVAPGMVIETYLRKDRYVLQSDTIKTVNKKMFLKVNNRYLPWLSVKAFENKDTVYITAIPKNKRQKQPFLLRYIPYEKITHNNTILYGFLECYQTKGDCKGELWLEQPIIRYFDPNQGVVGLKISNCEPVFWEKIDKNLMEFIK